MSRGLSLDQVHVPNMGKYQIFTAALFRDVTEVVSLNLDIIILIAHMGPVGIISGRNRLVLNGRENIIDSIRIFDGNCV